MSKCIRILSGTRAVYDVRYEYIYKLRVSLISLEMGREECRWLQITKVMYIELDIHRNFSKYKIQFNKLLQE